MKRLSTDEEKHLICRQTTPTNVTVAKVPKSTLKADIIINSVYDKTLA